MHQYYITGTSSGLGKALAEELLTYKNVTVTGIARRCTLQHENYKHQIIDLTNLLAAQTFQFQKHENAEKIVLINNAGTTGEIRYAGGLQYEDIIAAYHLNCVTPHILINNFIAAYKNHPAETVIVNVTSGAASAVYDGWSVYAATKAALDKMSECIAKELELAGSNIKLFSIAPGVMETPMQEAIRQADVKQFSRKQKFVDLHVAKSLHNPAHVAKKYVELIQQAKKITGVIHRISL